MFQSTVFTVLSFLFLSVLAAPTPSNQQLTARQTFYGRATFFSDGLGACGWTNSDSDSIVALSIDMYGNGEHCGQGVSITNTNTGQTVYATVADKCQSCGSTDLDLSMGAFQQIGNENDGVEPISWNFT